LAGEGFFTRSRNSALIMLLGGAVLSMDSTFGSDAEF
jgi:hypothetical protein